MPISPEIQLDLFRQAADLLGGLRTSARAMNVSERTMGRLLSGQALLHEGFLRDMAAALADYADQCRALERRLTPELSANRLPDQPQPDGRRLGRRWQKD